MEIIKDQGDKRVVNSPLSKKCEICKKYIRPNSNYYQIATTQNPDWNDAMDYNNLHIDCFKNNQKFQ